MNSEVKKNWVKPLGVLLLIVLLCTFLIAVCNDLLAVSEEEKFNRTLQKIYGGSASVKTTLSVTSENSAYEDGTVNAAYEMSDGNYLVNATGKGAYQGGTVTVWAVIRTKNGALEGVGKVLFDSTTVGKYFEPPAAFMEDFQNHDEEVSMGWLFGEFTGTVPATGATASARAINNAVNTAILFYKAVVGGEAETPSFDWKYASFVNARRVKAGVVGNAVTYTLYTKANGPAPEIELEITVENGKITAFAPQTALGAPPVYGEYVPESMKNGTYFLGKGEEELAALLNGEGLLLPPSENGDVPSTEASYSSASLVRAALFAAANYAAVLQEGGIS